MRDVEEVNLEADKIRVMIENKQDYKDIKNSIFNIDGRIMTRSIDVSKIFKKNHEIIFKDILGIINRFELNKEDLNFLGEVKRDKAFVVFNQEVEIIDIVDTDTGLDGKLIDNVEEVDIFLIDLIFWSVLVSGLISRRAVKLKSIWLNELILSMVEIERGKALCAIGCSEMPESVLGPVLSDITDKINKLSIAMEELLKRNKRRELTREEKLYKEMRLNKIKDKLSLEARKKLAVMRNADIQKEAGHGLVYDMRDVYEEEKERLEAENERRRIREVNLNNVNKNRIVSEIQNKEIGQEQRIEGEEEDNMFININEPREKGYEDLYDLEAFNERDRIGNAIRLKEFEALNLKKENDKKNRKTKKQERKIQNNKNLKTDNEDKITNGNKKYTGIYLCAEIETMFNKLNVLRNERLYRFEHGELKRKNASKDELYIMNEIRKFAFKWCGINIRNSCTYNVLKSMITLPLE